MAGACAQAGVATVGIQAKPVIPFTYFDPVSRVDVPPLSGSAEITGGFGFGMAVRVGLTKAISLETGISQITRRFDVAFANDTNGYAITDRIKLVGYEVPVLAMVYIRLGRNTWMNNALGLSADLYPSDAVRTQDFSRVYLARRSWASFGVVANIGFEYRTPKSGWFYLGATYHRPFGDIAQAEFTWYDASAFGTTVVAGVAGSYLTADVRYYFHNDPDKARRRRGDTRNTDRDQ